MKQNNRRVFGGVSAVIAALLLVAGAGASRAVELPKDVPELWAQFDFRKEPLKVEVVKEWSTDDGTFRLVRYSVGTLQGDNKKASPIMAAYYGFPKSAAGGKAKVPAILHLHGGGQRGDKERVENWVKLGYASMSINWGGKVTEEKDTPNTDWDGLAAGFIGSKEQIHNNDANSNPNTLFKRAHPLNSSWVLIGIAARRALTFLEQQPEVDASKLGVEGHSMGGVATVLTAIDSRVKAASPSVGGTGYLYQEFWGIPGSGRRNIANLDMYEKLVGAEAYWPHIQCPILFLGATDDFNSPTEWIFRGMATLPEKTPRRVALAAHYNHCFTESTSAARALWLESHLKGNFDFPKTARGELVLKTENGIPVFDVWPEASRDAEVSKVEIYYGYDRNPHIRFWRDGFAKQVGDHYQGTCPVFDVNEPLFAFANITYKLKRKREIPPDLGSGEYVTVVSEYRIALPDQLQQAGVKAMEKPQRLIDDFARGMHDWYDRTKGDSFCYGTHKLTDPGFMGPKGGELAFDVKTEAPNNTLGITINVNEWQGYTGRKRDEFFAFVDLPKAGFTHVVLKPGDCRNKQGTALTDWDEITQLVFQPGNRRTVGTRHPQGWKGKPPTFADLCWVGGEYGKRFYPYQPRGNEAARPAGEAEDEFQDAVKDSVQREKQGAGMRKKPQKKKNQ
mgnify:CR=1 FL=1